MNNELIYNLRKNLDNCTFSFDGREKMRQAVAEFEAALSQQEAEPVEPIFYCAHGWHNGGRIFIPGYASETENGVKYMILQEAREQAGYKGTIEGRLLELEWGISPVYEHPSKPASLPQPVTSNSRSLRNIGDELHNLSCYFQESHTERAEQLGALAVELWGWPAAPIPQDVEEFIAEKEFYAAITNPEEMDGSFSVPSDDLRAWMAGHVRVPDGYVEAVEKTIRDICINAVEKLNDLAPDGGWDRGEVVAEMYIKPLRAMLTASKEKTK